MSFTLMPQALSGALPLAPGETDRFKIAFAIAGDDPAPELAEVIAEVGAVSAGEQQIGGSGGLT
jgi:hypothetical protein